MAAGISPGSVISRLTSGQGGLSTSYGQSLPRAFWSRRERRRHQGAIPGQGFSASRKAMERRTEEKHPDHNVALRVGTRQWIGEGRKPILLDISAVWCHWCHRLDKDTYSVPDIGVRAATA